MCTYEVHAVAEVDGDEWALEVGSDVRAHRVLDGRRPAQERVVGHVTLAHGERRRRSRERQHRVTAHREPAAQDCHASSSPF